MNLTPHCGRFCGLDRKGREYHYHPGIAIRKLRRGRKGCRCDMCRRFTQKRKEPIDDRD